MLAVRSAAAALIVSATCATAWQGLAPAIAAEAAEQTRNDASLPLGGLDSGRAGAPTISRVLIGPDGTGHFEGLSTPRARIALKSKGHAIGRTTADDRGAWQLNLPKAFGSGDHRIEAVAGTGDHSEPSVGGIIRISIPEGYGSLPGRSAPPAGAAEQSQLLRAGELADQASQRFDELLAELAARNGGATKTAAIPGEAAPDLRPVQPVEPPVRVAQLDGKQHPLGTGGDASTLDSLQQWLASIMSDVGGWLEASARDYQSRIVRRLSEPAATALTTPASRAPPGSPPPPTITEGKQESRPADAQRLAEAERLRQSEAKRAAEAEAQRKSAEAKRIAALERAKAEAEAEAKRRAAAKADAEAKRKAAEIQREKAKAEAEAKRIAALEKAKAEAEADAKRKAAIEAKRRAEEEARRQQAAARPAQPPGEIKREPEDTGREQPLGASKDRRTASADKQEEPGVSKAGAKAAGAAIRPAKRSGARPAARRARQGLVRRASLGSDDLCSFLRYRYPLGLLDPGGWFGSGALRR